MDHSLGQWQAWKSAIGTLEERGGRRASRSEALSELDPPDARSGSGSAFREEMTDRPQYYRRDGTPYTGPEALWDWAKDFENQALKRVAYTEIADRYKISTVWLGLNHSLLSGKPFIFETMVFEKGWESKEMERYSTEEEAFKGHQKMVEKYKKKLFDDQADLRP